MPNVTANGIQIEYETFGDKSNTPLLLINGFGGQLIHWDEELCKQLAENNLYVIRYDNRDVGLSSKFFEKAGGPKVLESLIAVQQGKQVIPPYTLKDMADDAVGLLDSLNIEKAHVCGISMGGMIAQLVAIHYPSRIFSLISMSSSTGDPQLPPGTPEAQAALAENPPPDRDQFIGYFVKFFEALCGPGSDSDERLAKKLGEMTFDRSYYPQGRACQFLAVRTAGSSKEELKLVKIPTLVIHGDHDPVLPLEHGKATANAIPNSELVIVEGMWHVPVPRFYPQIVNAIAKHTHRIG